MKVIFRIVVIILLVALLGSVLIRNKQKIIYDASSAKQVLMEIPVEVTSVKKEQPAVVIRSAGIVESAEEVVIVSTVQGAVKSVDIYIGKTVNQGDLLATSDDYFAVKEYAIAKEAYDQLLKEYDRAKQLSKEDAVTGQQLEQLKIQLDGADTKQQSLQRRVEDTRIKASVSGIVNQVFIKKGGVLGNGSPICEIVNPNGLRITAHVSENDIELIQKGQQVILNVNSGTGNSYTGIVAGSGVKPDRTGLFPVNISLPSKVTGLKPGMLINTEIRVTSVPAILIPWRNIRTIDDKKGVFISDNNRAVFREIVTGKTYNNNIEVLSGIEEGVLLVTNGDQSLQNGDHLKIVKE